MKNVLVLAAHPDDAEIGLGATINKFAEHGDDVRLIIFTDGMSARVFPPSMSPEYEKIRRHEERRLQIDKSCTILGIKEYGWYGFKDNQMDSSPLLRVVKSIEDCCEMWKFRPDIVFTHSPWCLNIDHKIVSQAGITVFRGINKYGNPLGTNLYFYEVLSSSEWDPTREFKIDCYSRIDEHNLLKKIDALKCYSSENVPRPHPRNEEVIKSLAIKIGSECGAMFAEGFMVARNYLE